MAPWKEVAGAISIIGSLLLSKLAPELLLGGKIWKTVPALFVLLAFFWATYRIMIWPIYISPLRKLPQAPNSLPLIGQFRRILKEPSGAPQKEWAKTVPNDGLLCYRTIFNVERVLITGPKALAEVLVTRSYEFEKPGHLRRSLVRILGNGILVAEGDDHKHQRKNLNPAFAFRHVKDLFPIFWQKSVEMVKTMQIAITTPSSENEKPSNVVETGSWASRATLDIIGVAGFGKDFNALSDPENELFQTYQKILKPSRGSMFLGLFNMFLPRFIVTALPMKRNDELNEASNTIKRVARGLVQYKKEKLAKGETADKDILSTAIQSGGFSDESLVEQLMVLLIAGHETTASSMTWAIYELSRNRDIQTRLREELRSAGVPSPLASNNPSSKITASNIEPIPYLSAVVNEVLRVHPPVPFTFRQAMEDTTIQGHPIPKGSSIVLCPSATNQSTELWGEDAETFNPDRWMGSNKNNGGASSNYAFLTFLHGPRSCIGMGFARAEFMCLLAAWVMAFDTELEDPNRPIEIGGGITSRPKGGLKVKLTPIEA